MTTFVLVAGAWCWERLTPLLQVSGHRVIAPDLIGMGADVARLGDASLVNWGIVAAESLSSLTAQLPCDPVLTLVAAGGHDKIGLHRLRSRPALRDGLEARVKSNAFGAVRVMIAKH